MPDPTFSVFVPLGKLEDQPDGTLMVWGRATEEIKDSANEIMDYASSAPLFQTRQQENFQRSAGQNLMPLRSMHQNIAAGKVVQFDYKDGDKAIDICAHVVDPVEISKVKNHVYTGLSVGGKYARRWPDGGSMRYTADPREISLVDAPAVPTARLTLFKVEDMPEKQPEWVGEFKQAVEDMKKMKQAEEEQQAIALLKMKTIGENVGIAYREGSPLNASNPSEYGDPANGQWAAMDAAHATHSIDDFNKGVNTEMYSARERHILGRRLTQLASRFEKYQYHPETYQIEKDKTMSDQDLNKLDVGAIVSALKAASAQSAALASTDPNAALAMLLGHIDTLNTGSPVTGHNVPVNDPSVAMGKAVATGTTPSATAATTGDEESTASTSTPVPVKKAMPPQFKEKARATAPTSEETETTESSSSTDEPTEAYKKLEEKVDALVASMTSVVESLNKRAATPATSPAGALNALVSANYDPVFDDPIIKALDEGGPYALLKALKAAGAGDDVDGALAYQNMNNAIRKATYASLERGGVVTASRYVGRLFQAQ